MNLAIKILICDDSEEFAFWFYKKIDKLLHKDNFVCSFLFSIFAIGWSFGRF